MIRVVLSLSAFLVLPISAWAEPQTVPFDLRGASPDEGLRFQAPPGARRARLDRGIGIRLGDRYDSPMVAVRPVRAGREPIAQAKKAAIASKTFPLVKVHIDTADLLLWETQRPQSPPNFHFVAVMDLPAHKTAPAGRIQCDNRGLGSFTLTSARTLASMCRSVKRFTVLPPKPETAPQLTQTMALGDLPRVIGHRRLDGISLKAPEGATLKVGLGTMLTWREQTLLIANSKGKTIDAELAAKRKSLNRPATMLLKTQRAAIWQARADRAFYMSARAKVGDVELRCWNIAPLTRVQAETMVAICLSAHPSRSGTF